MKLSHSKLQTILTCPMTYFLEYKEGIKLKIEKPALYIGSAVHWGIEHNTDDLTEFYKESGSFKHEQGYTREQLLAESMVYGYLQHKKEIFDELLKDDDGNKLEMLEETHELFLEAELEGYKNNEVNNFVGIIDLLILTEKGFIVVDYKTSSQVPDWNQYLEQIYRYIYLLKKQFPEVPVYKIGIINLRKSMIRQKKDENEEGFLIRLKNEYKEHSDLYITTHIYHPSDLDENLISEYIENLKKMADMANVIDKNEMWYINYSNANGVYGKSQYYDIFYKTKDNYLLYKISDTLYDAGEDVIKNERDCVPIDMLVIDKKNILNKYDIFEKEVIDSEILNKDKLFPFLKSKYECDDKLLEKYYNTFLYKNN